MYFQTNLFIVNLAFSDLCMMTTQALPVSINAFVQDVWMYGPLMCKVYACIGGIFGKFCYLKITRTLQYYMTQFWKSKHVHFIGTCSLLTMVCIGYDRYNVIVKGMAGTRITYGMAILMILCIWIYSTLICIPPFLGWGGYALGKFQGNMIKFRCFNLSRYIGKHCVNVLRP